MNTYFYRKKALILLKEFNTIEETKNHFSKKLKLILEQYILLKKNLLESKIINKKFILSSLYSIDLNIKKIEALIFLSSSGDPEWNVLNIFIESKKNIFLDLPNIVNVKILNIDKIGDFRKKFFYILKKYHIIDSEQHYILQQINIARDNLSIPHLNDYFLDDHELDNIVKFDNLKTLNNFCNTPLKLRKFDTKFWNFVQLILINHISYLELCIQILKNNDYDFLKINNQISEIKNWSKNGFANLFIPNLIYENKELTIKIIVLFQNILADIYQNIGKIYFYFEQIDSFEHNKFDPLLKQLLFFFLASDCIKNSINAIELRKNNERLLHAEYHLDLIKILLKDKSFFQKLITSKNLENFLKINKAEFSIFKNQNIFENMRDTNFKEYIILVKKIKKIIYSSVYKNELDFYLREYFENLKLIGLPNFFKYPPKKINLNLQ